MRTGGILLPVASLPSKYGIGCFSREAYEFIDQLEKAGQKLWQILPLGPTGFGNSPYQSYSTFAGNPLLIDLETLIKEGLLTEAECQNFDFTKSENYIEYDLIVESRAILLKQAFQRFEKTKEYEVFVEENAYWLEDYALFQAEKEEKKDSTWVQWEQPLRDRDPETLKAEKERLAKGMAYQSFVQYEFYRQWEAVKSYANQKGILIIGDMPIYVSFDSSDAWANPLLFQFDEEHKPIGVAGCPPDYFAPQGQLWGNPLYDWPYHKKTGYAWWIQRMQHSQKLFDVVRIDHFRGFDAYYSVPYGDKTAEFGHWEEGPGLELFTALKEKIGDLDVIAEDLGFLTESVLQLVRDTGYPGMKVLEFAFDSDPDCLYLPHNVIPNSIMYTGTHDNDTLKGWLGSMSDATKSYLLSYLDDSGEDQNKVIWKLIRLAISSVSERAVIPMQDYLCKGSEARINIPATVGDNWKWRMLEGEFTDSLAEKIRKISKIYGR